jgi:hypothetical protein
MNIVGYHINKDGAFNSDGEKQTEPSFMDFLLASKNDCIKVMYDLDYSVACLCRLLEADDRDCKNLAKGNLWWEPYHLRYVPGKFLSIKKGKAWEAPYVLFSDIKQYTTTDIDLYDLKPFVCARFAQELGQAVQKVMQSLNTEPETLTSPISIYEKQVLNKLDLPTSDHIPDEANEFAYECNYGGWIEAFKLGSFKQAYDYDITSAYPYFLSQLVDIRKGIWKHTSEYQKQAYYGYCHCVVTIDSNFSPIIAETDDINYTAIGTWETYLTKSEIDFINAYQLGNTKIIDGWWWIPHSLDALSIKPLAETMVALHQKRMQSTEFANKIIKRIMVGSWGKLLEAHYLDNTVGKHFNPVWGVEVETSARLACAKFVLDNGLYPDHLLHIAVDGILATKHIAIANNETLGSWKISSIAPAIVAGSNAVAIKDKDNNADFSLKYDWLAKEILHNPESDVYVMKSKQPVVLGHVLQNENNITKYQELGNIVNTTRSVDITYEKKRLYNSSPECGKDLLNNQYSSIPCDATMLEILEKEDVPM